MGFYIIFPIKSLFQEYFYIYFLKSIIFFAISSTSQAFTKLIFPVATSGMAATSLAISFCHNAETSATTKPNHSAREGMTTKSERSI
ncbi:hypothetical protein H6769_03025 [Candidatus Peribacteria bacterium]|nr:hypothetical protein [Candidatus Peribacteria bacterium]